MSNWYKPRYKFCYIIKNKIWPYKSSRLRKMIDKRGRSIYRKGWWPHRRFMVMKSLKWTLFRKRLGTSFSLFSFKNSRKKRIYSPQNKYKIQSLRFKSFRMVYGKIDREKFQHLFQRFFKNKFIFKFLNFLKSLEFRLDVILFRLKIFPTIFGCHNLIKNVGIYINGNLIKTPGFLVQIGDIISFSSYIWNNLMILFFEKINDRLHREYLSQQRYNFKYFFFKKLLKNKNQLYFHSPVNLNQKYLETLNKGFYSKKSLYFLKWIDKKFFFGNSYNYKLKKNNRLFSGYYIFQKFFKENLKQKNTFKDKMFNDFIFLLKKRKKTKLINFVKKSKQKNLLKFYNKYFNFISYVYFSQNFLNLNLKKIKNDKTKNFQISFFSFFFKKYYFKMLYYLKIYFNLKKLSKKFIINYLSKNKFKFFTFKLLILFNFFENRFKLLFNLLKQLRTLIKINSNLYILLNSYKQKNKDFKLNLKIIKMFNIIKNSIKNLIFQVKYKIIIFFMNFSINIQILNKISLLMKNLYFFISFIKTKKIFNNIFYFKILESLKFNVSQISSKNLNLQIKKILNDVLFNNEKIKLIFSSKNINLLINQWIYYLENKILKTLNNKNLKFNELKSQNIILNIISSFIYLQINKEIWSIYFFNLYHLNNLQKIKKIDNQFYYKLINFFNQQNLINSNTSVKIQESFKFPMTKYNNLNIYLNLFFKYYFVKNNKLKNNNKKFNVNLYPNRENILNNLQNNNLKFKLYLNSSFWSLSMYKDYKKYLINLNKNNLNNKLINNSKIQINWKYKWNKIRYNKIKKILTFLKKNRRKFRFKQKRFLNLKTTHNWYIPSYLDFDFNTLQGIVISEPFENAIVFSLCEPFYLRSLISFYKRIGF